MVWELYVDHHSSPCRSVIAFFKMNDIPHEIKVVDFFKGEHKKPEFVSLCPIARIPLLRDSVNGLILTESAVIMQFACQRFGLGEKWFPKLAAKRARIMEYCAWQQSTGLRTAGIISTLVVGPLIHKTPVDEKKLEADVEKLESKLNIIENYFLKDHEFLASKDISIADISAYPEILTQLACGYPVGKDRPKLTKWLENMRVIMTPHDGPNDELIIKAVEPFKRQF